MAEAKKISVSLPNYRRSDIFNPNNSSYNTSVDNPSNQMNPNNLLDMQSVTKGTDICIKSHVGRIDSVTKPHTQYYNKINTSSEGIKWSWACRILESAGYQIDNSFIEPKVGDLVLVQVEQIGYHRSIVTTDNKKLRIYVGDLLVGVFGNRYATDALEGEVNGLHNLSILTAGGMIGTIKSKHSDFGKLTNVSFVGFLNDEKGQKINLKELKFHQSLPQNQINRLIIVVGTGMNTGKTTTSSKLIKGLSVQGFKIAACKLTGSVSNRDQDEMRSASAQSIIDFSDYGFPSTYLCTKEELLSLFNTMLADLEKANPDLVVMEIADGILQRETAILLSDPSIKRMVKGVLLTSESAPSALYAVENLKKLGYNVIAVSGKMTSSPLSVKEFTEHCKVQVCSSVDSGKQLADIVSKYILPSISV